MKPSVRAAFVPFTIPMEGSIAWMYLDVKGLVTTAIGNLIDPIAYALPLPFMKPDGTAATQAEITSEWLRVKARKDMAMRGGVAFKAITTLRLTPDGIELVVGRKLTQVDAHLRARFAGYDAWPADAQLGVLSMAWACGPAFRFPVFEAAVRSLDFAYAATECRMDETGNPGLRPRNIATRTLFRNAAHVVAESLDPDVLYFPRVLDEAAATEPEVVNPPSEDHPTTSASEPTICVGPILHPDVPLGRPDDDDT